MDVRDRGGDHGAQAEVGHRPRGVFARAPAAVVVSGDEDGGALGPGLV